MLQQFQQLLPDLPNHRATLLCAICAPVGLVIFLTGSCYSRSLLTLASVAVATYVGKHLPQYFGWHVDGMIPAITFAIVAGVLAYTLDRVLLSTLFVLLATFWTAITCWSLNGSAFSFPAYRHGTDVVDYVNSLWHSVPVGLHLALPIAGLSVVVVTILLAVFRPRLTRILFNALLGLTLILAAIALKSSPLPRSPQIQLALILVFLAVGVFFQSRFATPCARASSVSSAPPKSPPPPNSALHAAGA